MGVSLCKPISFSFPSFFSMGGGSHFPALESPQSHILDVGRASSSIWPSHRLSVSLPASQAFTHFSLPSPGLFLFLFCVLLLRLAQVSSWAVWASKALGQPGGGGQAGLLAQNLQDKLDCPDSRSFFFTGMLLKECLSPSVAPDLRVQTPGETKRGGGETILQPM